MNDLAPITDLDLENVGPVTPVAGINSKITTAGAAVLVAAGDAVDGYIINPGTIIDQGIPTLNVLYVDPTNIATPYATATTVAIQPGGRYDFPPNVGTGIWANSNASGHKFTAVQIIPTSLIPPSQADLDAAYQKGNFPPTGPTGVLSPIPSYLYQEYSDDDDLQAFVAAYNSMMQDIIDTFNGLNLPNYTNPTINGALLDWVAQGIYGMMRPSLSSGKYQTYGPYNTGMYNTEPYNYWDLVYPNILSVTSDDVFKRILTWHLSKREGRYFTIQWLKKRIMKFLFGINGSQPNIDNTYQVSITFGPNFEVTIRFITGNRFITGGSMYDAWASVKSDQFTYNNMMYAQLDSTYINLTPLPNVDIFQEAVASGALELPFQFHYDIVIG
jgi:hypothetical protein